MRKILIIFLLMFLSISETFAYAMKVYDEYGNRIGTYRKEGGKYQLYDFNDKKVDDPSELIQNAPTQRTLTEYSTTIYDANMMPIGTYRSGLYGNNGRYYPRGFYIPTGVYIPSNSYIVRPNAKGIIKRNNINNFNPSTTIIRSTDVDPFTNTLLKF